MSTRADSRTEIIRFRLTPDELLDIDEKAYELQISRSDYLRRMALNKEVVIYDFSGLDSLSAQIGKIGVNINQIARKLNQGDTLERENAEYLLGAMSTIHEMLKQLYEDTMKQKGNNRDGSDGN